MATNFISTGLSGAVFGSALLLSGVYSPTIILAQLELSDFYMLKVFLTASGSSAILMEICKRANIVPCKPREASNLNLLSRYDGNIIGGLILGCGMALTGACPGTVLVQVASGISSGVPVLAGGILGGILWSRFGYCVKCAPTTPASEKGSTLSKNELTLYDSTKMSSAQAVLLFEIVCLSVIIAASYLLPDPYGSKLLNPVLGGLLIGGAQAASLILTRGLIGVSTAYERLGDYICRFAGLSPCYDSTWPSPSPLVFALGMIVGTWSLSHALGMTPVMESTQISVARAAVGGVALIIGARTAGGCTSGHGISGMAALSKASFATVGAMFAGGMGLSGLLRFFK
ncbi:YeeE/YedE family protein [Leptodontidium sp. MPI-SDFR-AT-0119]|nr:YeeE/YedE family protein [Leptodontidium sp. MPI-SDFR-AT-0119]